jgi:hypothetical protein
MSFEAVWGFDPEDILRTQRAFHNAEEKSVVSEAELTQGQEIPDQEVEGVRMPSGFGAQVYELRRLFRS